MDGKYLNVKGDEKEEYTFVESRRHTVIDYRIINTEGINKIEQFRVLERTESDHMPPAN